MAERDLTVESLAEIIQSKGLEAAKAAVARSKGSLEVEAGQIAAQMVEFQRRQEDLKRRLGTFDTLLIGGVRRAASEMGIILSAPAPAAKKNERKGRMSKDEKAAAIARILELIKEGGKEGVKRSSIESGLTAAGLAMSYQTLDTIFKKLLSDRSISLTKSGRENIYHPV
jgi:hypothetical protein